MEKSEKLPEILSEKIYNKDITVGIVGLGYVGLPLALEFALKRYKTYGIDISERKVETLKKGGNYIEDLKDEEVSQVVRDNNLIPTNDFSKLGECDAIFICVPTPFTENKDPDISYIIQAAEDTANNLKKGQVIILKSTTFPGTTEKYVQPILEGSGLKAGEDFYLAFSPERIDPGNKTWNTKNTPIVVGGINKISTELACKVHALVVEKVVPVTSPKVAELEKLLENIFRSVNIALVNELAKLCDRIGVNVWEVVESASSKPFGFMPFYPGPGIGGHCILVDPYYLAWMAREHDFVTKFITLAAEVNEDMPNYVTQMVIKEIAKQPIVLNEAKVLLLGVAFKKDVRDTRHSPALKVAEFLHKEGVKIIHYYDPYVPEIEMISEMVKSEEEFDEDMLSKYDVVIITTNHSSFDMDMICRSSKVVVDTRNACRDLQDKYDNIVLLGDGK